MDGLTDLLVSQMLSSLDPSPVNPTREQKFMAFLICKNLTDLGETGLSILNDMKDRGVSIQGLPEPDSIYLCQNIIKKYYSDEMFVKDDDFGYLPNWSEVTSFDKNKTDTSYRIYRAIRNNVMEKPESELIREAVKNKDRDFFVENFDSIFADIPFKEGLTEFKNFLQSSHVTEEHQNIVWEFFETLLEVFIDEAEFLDELREM